MRKKLLLFLVALALGRALGQAADFPGKKSTWHNYARYDFKIGDADCRVVKPHKTA